MADSKVSELQSADALKGTDQFYLVQGSASKKLSYSNLFLGVDTPASFSDKVAIADHGTITARGEINTTNNVTFISNVDSAGSISIATGIEGQIQIIIMSSNTGGHTVNLTGANVQGTVSFSSAGDSATLIYSSTNSKWYFIGGTATVS